MYGVCQNLVLMVSSSVSTFREPLRLLLLHVAAILDSAQICGNPGLGHIVEEHTIRFEVTVKEEEEREIFLQKTKNVRGIATLFSLF